MGMCSNLKKSPKAELENSIRPEKPEEIKNETPHVPPLEEEFKDMVEWEGNYTLNNLRRKIFR
jgi:hypothetical protein